MGKVKLNIEREIKRAEIVRLNSNAADLLYNIMLDTKIGAGPLVSAMIRYVAENGYEIIENTGKDEE